MDKFIPHIHTCELKLCKPHSWAEHCPLKGNLSETQDECEQCIHYVMINFDPDNPMCMKEVVRASL